MVYGRCVRKTEPLLPRSLAQHGIDEKSPRSEGGIRFVAAVSEELAVRRPVLLVERYCQRAVLFELSRERKIFAADCAIVPV